MHLQASEVACLAPPLDLPLKNAAGDEAAPVNMSLTDCATHWPFREPCVTGAARAVVAIERVKMTAVFILK
jgi:hypothetical protein